MAPCLDVALEDVGDLLEAVVVDHAGTGRVSINHLRVEAEQGRVGVRGQLARVRGDLVQVVVGIVTVMLDTTVRRAIGNPSGSWRRRMMGMLLTGLPRAEHLGHDGETDIGRFEVKARHVPRPFDVAILDEVIAI